MSTEARTERRNVTREEAQAMTGPALAEALHDGRLGRELAEDLFRPEIVRLMPGPSRGAARYGTSVFGWGRWWMPGLYMTAAEAWAYVQEVATRYGAEVEVAEEVAQDFPPS